MFAALTLLLVAQKSPGLSKTLADGSKATLVEVTSVLPDALKRFAPVKPGGKAKPSKGRPLLIFKISGGRPGEAPSVSFKAGKDILPNAFLYPDEKQGGWWAGAELPPKKSRVDISVGLGVGKWVGLSTHDLQTGITKGPKFFAGILRDVKTGKPGKSISVVDVTTPKELSQAFATRIKLFELGGSSPQFLGIGPITAGGNSRWQYVENDKRVIKAELQTRPYRWVAFGSVSVPKG